MIGQLYRSSLLKQNTNRQVFTDTVIKIDYTNANIELDTILI